jgi:hypothetical protein
MYLDDSLQQRKGNRIAWIIGLIIIGALMVMMVMLK